MRPACRLTAFLGLVILVVAPSTATAAAQAVFGAITGTVTDSSGAVLPGATVSVTNIRTNVTKTRATNEAGVYNATNLIPGIYRVDASPSGCKTAVVSAVTVEVNAKHKV